MTDAGSRPTTRWRSAIRSRADAAYALVVLVLGVLTVLPWWLTELLPMMDYAQYLTFVRAFQDFGDPASPFHGTYEVARPWAPLGLPVALTSALSVLGGIEGAGRLLMSAYALGLPAAAAWLLRAAGVDRWHIVWVFPLVFSRIVSWGFFGFVTALPMIVAFLALAFGFLRAPTPRRGSALAILLLVLAFWHGLAICVAGCLYGALWLCWRAPSWRQRWAATLPLVPAGVLFLVWSVAFVDSAPARGPRFEWLTLESAFDTEQFFNRVFMLHPRADIFAKLGVLVVALGVASSFGQPPAVPEPTRDWRVKRPLLALAWASLLAYFALPYKTIGVEVVNYRFIWLAALFLGLGAAWPASGWKRWLHGAVALGLALVFLIDINGRFRSFHRDTVGASRLIDRLKPGDTLLAPIKKTGTVAFPIHHPVRDVQLYATIRHGGLPSWSFAESPTNYVHYVDQRNPMPKLGAHDWARTPALRRFDYVLLREPLGAALTLKSVTLIARDGGWALFAVCGGRAAPSC